ncbi:MAG: AAA family ATPase, partial [Bacillota bacterium]|nr:AAA family ATPase [Bacillota bacterium]
GVFEEGVYVITGGPGTGKTTIVNAIIGAFEKQAKEVILCAPTGRAAKKLSDATHRNAKTIHRTLGANGENFTKGPEDLLKCDAVIVDEVSMVDIFLMNNLLRAIAPGTSLILVGDKDQLPSVGAGSVLRDILSSGKIRVIRLTHIFRQSEKSMISINAGRIINGRMPQNGEDFFVFKGGDALYERVIDMVTRKIPERFGFCPMTEIQVLSVKYDGDAGVNALNAGLKAQLNPHSSSESIKTPGGKEFFPGDKVMQTANNYDIEWTDSDSQVGKGIFNGDIGRIAKIDFAAGVVHVDFEDGRLAVYDRTDLTELTHAYAITVHKSQGSEYPCIVMPIFPAYTMENRNILYTAVTRAKRLVVLMGETSVLQRFVDRVNIDDRRSTLSEKLIYLFETLYGGNHISE